MIKSPVLNIVFDFTMCALYIFFASHVTGGFRQSMTLMAIAILVVATLKHRAILFGHFYRK